MPIRMCLILLAHNVLSQFPLVLLANRDEFLDRPTRRLAWWNDHPDLLAGRDLKAGGTWLGVSRPGRIAAVTNFREPAAYSPEARSRGELVSDFLIGEMDPEDYLAAVSKHADFYNGFNLLAWRSGKLAYYSNRRGQSPRVLGGGVFGLSNDVLDTPWPKVERGKRLLTAALKSGTPDASSLIDLMYDVEVASDDTLPHTGMTLEQERALSSIFIRMGGYGTRSTSVLIVNANGRLDFHERAYDDAGRVDSIIHHSLQLEL